jgi:hypothetical protein
MTKNNNRPTDAQVLAAAEIITVNRIIAIKATIMKRKLNGQNLRFSQSTRVG